MRKILSTFLVLSLMLSPALAESTPQAQTPTPVPATATPQAPTPVPATATPQAQTPTPVPATATPEVQTPTPVPATATPEAQTPTPVPATATPEAQTPTPEPGTQQPTQVPEPTQTATPEPGTATPEAGVTPGVSPTPEASVTPEVSPTPEASVTPEVSPTPEPSATPVPQLEGYLLDQDGVKLRGGPLAELLMEPGKLRICVSTRQMVKLEAFPLMRLQEITFEPDVYMVGENYRVVLSTSDSLRDELTSEAIAAFTPESVGDLYIWLREELPQPTATPEPGPGMQLTVSAENYVDGAWSCLQPVFTLEGIAPEDSQSNYAAIILDERIVMLSGNVYQPQEEGEYSVRFVIMDPMGDLADRSEPYNLRLDYTPPTLGVEVSMEKDRTMTLHFADALSGLDAFSLDGGANWTPIEAGMESYTYTAEKKQVFAPGMILLRDLAGNISANAEEVTLAKLPSFSGGGGGGGSSEPKKEHASGDGDDARYNSYELELPEGEVDKLTLGGEAVDLSLEIQTQEGAQPGLFTASLMHWKRENEVPAATTAPGSDTLVLRAAMPQDIAAEEAYRCVWKINGAVLRKLYNSDIRYLLLDVNGTMLSLPTEGFVAGTRYAELKMHGVSTGEFDYEIHMRMEPSAQQPPEGPAYSRAQRCVPEIWAQVAGERFEMKDRLSTPEMYPLQVYCAEADLIEYPYGKYPAFDSADETQEEGV